MSCRCSLGFAAIDWSHYNDLTKTDNREATAALLRRGAGA